MREATNIPAGTRIHEYRGVPSTGIWSVAIETDFGWLRTVSLHCGLKPALIIAPGPIDSAVGPQSSSNAGPFGQHRRDELPALGCRIVSLHDGEERRSGETADRIEQVMVAGDEGQSLPPMRWTRCDARDVR